MKPKVLVVSSSLSRGGMERQLSTFLRHYDRTKLQITVALLRNTIEYDLPDDVEIIDLKRRFAKSPLFYYKLWRALSNKKYDLINSKISGVNEVVLLFCGLLNKSNVIIEIRNTKKKLLFHYRRVSRLFRFFNKDWWVICNSKVAQREVREILHNKGQVWFVGNGVDTDHFTRCPSSLNAEFTIVFVGRITPQKNIEALIRSLPFLEKIIKSYKLILQGTIVDSEYYQFLQSEINALALTSRITFIAPHEQDVRDSYSGADVFVLPSLYEGTPNVLLEAMSCECVCLCSHGANTDQFLSNEFTFCNDRPDELAEKINYIAQLSDTERRAIGKRNRSYIAENYSVPKMVNALTDIIYKKLSDQHGETA